MVAGNGGCGVRAGDVRRPAGAGGVGGCLHYPRECGRGTGRRRERTRSACAGRAAGGLVAVPARPAEPGRVRSGPGVCAEPALSWLEALPEGTSAPCSNNLRYLSHRRLRMSAGAGGASRTASSQVEASDGMAITRTGTSLVGRSLPRGYVSDGRFPAPVTRWMLDRIPVAGVFDLVLQDRDGRLDLERTGPVG